MLDPEGGKGSMGIHEVSPDSSNTSRYSVSQPLVPLMDEMSNTAAEMNYYASSAEFDRE